MRFATRKLLTRRKFVFTSANIIIWDNPAVNFMNSSSFVLMKEEVKSFIRSKELITLGFCGFFMCLRCFLVLILCPSYTSTSCVQRWHNKLNFDGKQRLKLRLFLAKEKWGGDEIFHFISFPFLITIFWCKTLDVSFRKKFPSTVLKLHFSSVHCHRLKSSSVRLIDERKLPQDVDDD